jgi:hypothetical protein
MSEYIAAYVPTTSAARWGPSPKQHAVVKGDTRRAGRNAIGWTGTSLCGRTVRHGSKPMPFNPESSRSCSTCARAVADLTRSERVDVEPRTTDGIQMLAQFPVDAAVAFDFAPEPDLPDGLSGVARVVGVVEDVSDDGDGESGPHLSVYIVLALEHDGTIYHCHPDDGTSHLRVVAPAALTYVCMSTYMQHWPTAAGDSCRRCGAALTPNPS